MFVRRVADSHLAQFAYLIGCPRTGGAIVIDPERDVDGRGKLIMAEFNYDKEPVETIPVDQRAERFSMYALKAYMLPRLYWHGKLRGRA